MNKRFTKLVRQQVMRIAAHYVKDGMSKEDALKRAWESTWKLSMRQKGGSNMVITVASKEHIIDRDEVDGFIASLDKGTEFSIREVGPDKTYERLYIR